MQPEAPPPVDPKPFWQSRTVLSLAATALVAILRACGVGVDESDPAVAHAVYLLAELVGLVMAFVGRARADRPLSTGGPAS